VSPIRGYVFDAYGTLFDVHSVVVAGRAITSDPAALSATWRQKQLEYTWLRALMGAYVDFWAVTEAALRHTVRRLGLAASDAQMRRLMEAYLSLACFPEVPVALERLAGRPRAVLSNGAPTMLAAAVASSGLARHLEHVISADAVAHLQAVAARVRARPRDARHSGGRALVRVLERLGRCRRENVRLPGRVVQPRGRTRGRARRARRRGRPHARSAPPLRAPDKTKAARRRRAAQDGQEKPAPSYVLPASFFLFT
jgi:2-haloalkanoic acid dehalogenase type II